MDMDTVTYDWRPCPRCGCRQPHRTIEGRTNQDGVAQPGDACTHGGCDCHRLFAEDGTVPVQIDSGRWVKAAITPNGNYEAPTLREVWRRTGAHTVFARDLEEVARNTGQYRNCEAARNADGVTVR